MESGRIYTESRMCICVGKKGGNSKKFRKGGAHTMCINFLVQARFQSWPNAAIAKAKLACSATRLLAQPQFYDIKNSALRTPAAILL